MKNDYLWGKEEREWGDGKEGWEKHGRITK